MGRELVNKVAEWAAHLDPVERAALQYMANSARDKDTPPVYWRGWEALAAQLGYARRGAKKETARANTMKVLRQLQDKGLTTSSRGARKGRRPHYALNLDPGTVHVCTWFSPDGRTSKWQSRPRADPRAPEHRGLAEWANREDAEGETPMGAGSEDDYPTCSDGDYPTCSEGHYPYSKDSNELHQVGKGAAAAHPTGPSVPPAREAGELTPTTETEDPAPDMDDGGGWTGWGTPAPAEEGDNRALQERKNEQLPRLRAAYPGMSAA